MNGKREEIAMYHKENSANSGSSDEDVSRPTNYKVNYLQSGSQSTIPSSTWYRFQRKRREQEENIISKKIHLHNTENENVIPMEISNTDLPSDNETFITSNNFDSASGTSSVLLETQNSQCEQLIIMIDEFNVRGNNTEMENTEIEKTNSSDSCEDPILSQKTEITDDVMMKIHNCIEKLSEDVDSNNYESEDEENYFDAEADNDFPHYLEEEVSI